jgi:hypothetical protein
MTTYVVKTIDIDGTERKKVWRALPDARKVFDAVCRLVPDERQAAYLYEVPGEDDPYAAWAAVQAGKAILLDRSVTIDETLQRAGLAGL